VELDVFNTGQALRDMQDVYNEALGSRPWPQDRKSQSYLCGDCNSMLGRAKDTPATLLSAAEYLQRHSNAELKSLPR